MTTVDVLVVGAGMAGAGLAYALAPDARVMLVETEDAAGRHATGRSAALFTEAYGNAAIRALTAASRGFLAAPPSDFCDHPLLTPRGCIYLAGRGGEAVLARRNAEVRRGGTAIEAVGPDAARAHVPILRATMIAGGLFEAGAADIDVDGLLNGFLRGARMAGAELRVSAGLVALDREGQGWVAALADGTRVRAGLIVNAAGAWADQIAAMAGARPLGLAPLKRTALLLEAPAGADVAAWPAVIDMDERFYFKPEAGRLLASPADETPWTPGDAWADELDIAVCVDRVQAVADLPVRRVLSSWAGLRTFARDRTPVVGFDPDRPGFFWLAGQGGYGVQTAPAMSLIAAALLMGQGMPANLQARGLSAATLSPARFR